MNISSNIKGKILKCLLIVGGIIVLVLFISYTIKERNIIRAERIQQQKDEEIRESVRKSHVEYNKTPYYELEEYQKADGEGDKKLFRWSNNTHPDVKLLTTTQKEKLDAYERTLFRSFWNKKYDLDRDFEYIYEFHECYTVSRDDNDLIIKPLDEKLRENGTPFNEEFYDVVKKHGTKISFEDSLTYKYIDRQRTARLRFDKLVMYCRRHPDRTALRHELAAPLIAEYDELVLKFLDSTKDYYRPPITPQAVKKRNDVQSLIFN